jgi:hypothetical protein
VLSTADFKGFAKEVVPFLHVTSHVEGEKNPDLLSEKGGQGFPYVVAMDAEGRVTAVLKGRSLPDFRAMVESGKAYTARREKKDLSLDERIEMFRFDLKVGNLDLEGGRAALAAMKGLSKEQKAELEGALMGLEIRSLAPKSRDPEAARAAGKAYAAMWKEGREPTTDDDCQPFFIFMLDHAEAEKDAELFEKALKKLKDRFGGNPQAAGFFEKQDKRLAKLKE